MTRVVMASRASRWWLYYLGLFGWLFLTAVLDEEWGSAAFATAVLVYGLLPTANSLRWQLIGYFVGMLLIVTSTAIALVQRDWLWSVLGGVMAVLVGVFLPTVRKEGAGGRIRTEELVGKTVAVAERLVGYPKGREPGGLATPRLLTLPGGEQPEVTDPDRRAALIVTAVAVDPVASTITFGVAEQNAAPDLARTNRAALQQQLIELVGGFPADLRPVGVMDSTTRRQTRAAATPA